MRWLVTLSGLKQDVELLAGASLDERLYVDPNDSSQLLLELHDPGEGAVGSDANEAAKATIDGFVHLVNGFGRLRWGRKFRGLSATTIRSFDSADEGTQVVFVDPAFDHMLPEEFADTVEWLGYPRPAPPAGVDLVNALELETVVALAEANPDVIRVLRLIDLMLVGEEDIDWAVGYVALEIIEQDLRSRGEDGQALGWWTKGERSNFRATANSPEALGIRARHGKPSGLPKARMTSHDANWFVRRVMTHWINHLHEAAADRAT